MAVHQPAAHVAAGGRVRRCRHRPAGGRVCDDLAVGQFDAEHQRLTGMNVNRVLKFIVGIGEEIGLQIFRIDRDGLHGESVQVIRMNRRAGVGHGQLQHVAGARPQRRGRMCHVRPTAIAAVAVQRRGRVAADVGAVDAAAAVRRRADREFHPSVGRAVTRASWHRERIGVQHLQIFNLRPDCSQQRHRVGDGRVGAGCVCHDKEGDGIIRRQDAEGIKLPRIGQRPAEQLNDIPVTA